jgi:hypothetical protein
MTDNDFENIPVPTDDDAPASTVMEYISKYKCKGLRVVTTEDKRVELLSALEQIHELTKKAIPPVYRETSTKTNYVIISGAIGKAVLSSMEQHLGASALFIPGVEYELFKDVEALRESKKKLQNQLLKEDSSKSKVQDLENEVATLKARLAAAEARLSTPQVTPIISDPVVVPLTQLIGCDLDACVSKEASPSFIWFYKNLVWASNPNITPRNKPIIRGELVPALISYVATLDDSCPDKKRFASEIDSIRDNTLRIWEDCGLMSPKRLIGFKELVLSYLRFKTSFPEDLLHYDALFRDNLPEQEGEK